MTNEQAEKQLLDNLLLAAKQQVSCLGLTESWGQSEEEGYEQREKELRAALDRLLAERNLKPW